MLKRILATIGVLWGGGILLSGLWGTSSDVGASCARGQAIGFLIGAVLFGAGVYFLVRSGKKSTPRKRAVRSDSA